MKKVVFIQGRRTPFGSFGGTLKNFSATDLALYASQQTLAAAAVKLESIDHIIFGQVVGANADSAYLPRHVGLKLGIPVDRPAYSVNRLCGSGFQSWIDATMLIQLEYAQVVLAGGTESMSQIPFINSTVRFGQKMGHFELQDLLTSALTDRYPNLAMAMTAENLGEHYKLRRDLVDEYSLLSQRRYQSAFTAGVFSNEIAPINIQSTIETHTLRRDEHAKFDTSLNQLAQLKSIFKIDGLVTAGTASGIADGAAASILANEHWAIKNQIRPLARIIHWTVVGCPPDIMGIGPVYAIKKLLQETSLTLANIDLFEVNEAFAAQYLAVEKELQLDRLKTNIHGGAIAMGHPLGASGTRIMNHLAAQLDRLQLRYAIGSACIGGGQGVAILIERYK